MSHHESTARLELWIGWLRDYVTVATQFTQEDPIEVASNKERELVAIKAALYARALTLCQGALLLIENDRQLDFRVHARGVIEAAMYLIALDRNAAFVTMMKDDDYKSRHSRAGLHLNAKDFNGTVDVRKMLEDFLAQGLQGAKAIQVSTLLEGSEFDRLYRAYREISGDSAHVSITSLNRHYIENPADQSAMLIVHPPLDEIETHMTFAELGISMTIATLILMKIKAKTDLWDEFQTLLVRYQEVARANTAGRHEAENDRR